MKKSGHGLDTVVASSFAERPSILELRSGTGAAEVRVPRRKDQSVPRVYPLFEPRVNRRSCCANVADQNMWAPAPIDIADGPISSAAAAFGQAAPAFDSPTAADGGRDRDRTCDPLDVNEVLSR